MGTSMLPYQTGYHPIIQADQKMRIMGFGFATSTSVCLSGEGLRVSKELRVCPSTVLLLTSS